MGFFNSAVFFFFSSRRRHTRFKCEWSSDVCSSDLRSSGVPFAYAAGRTGFRTLDLRLDPRALIPRPETEGLVDRVLAWSQRVQPATWNEQRGGRWGVVADVGTGCGCIALALAVEGRFGRVIAVERSAEAAALAR